MKSCYEGREQANFHELPNDIARGTRFEKRSKHSRETGHFNFPWTFSPSTLTNLIMYGRFTSELLPVRTVAFIAAFPHLPASMQEG